MSNGRDPREIPEIGDTWEKRTESGDVLRRTVTNLVGGTDPIYGYVGNVFYSQNGGPENSCFAATWREWTRDAEFVE